MNRYGQTITWGPLSAPALFTGAIERYSYRDAATKQLITGGDGENLAIALHSQKAELSFEAKATSGSTNFLDLSSTAAAIAVSGLSAGRVLASRCVERWRLLQPKTCSIEATHYPDFATGSGGSATASLSAFTPAAQALASLLFPGAGLIYSTVGLGHAAGVVHELTLTQTLRIVEDEPSPDGKLLGAATAGYERTISLLLLATGARPAVKSVLALTGAPDHASGYRITSAAEQFESEKGKMYSIEASWIPAMAA